MKSSCALGLILIWLCACTGSAPATGILPAETEAPATALAMAATATLAPTKTPDEVATPIAAPIIEPLPTGSSAEDQQAQDEIAKWVNGLWNDFHLYASGRVLDGVGGSLSTVLIHGSVDAACLRSKSSAFAGEIICAPWYVGVGGFRPYPSRDVLITPVDINYYPLFLIVHEDHSLKSITNDAMGFYLQEYDAQGSPLRYMGWDGQWHEGEYLPPPYTVTQLDANGMKEAHGIIGTGLEINGEYQGIPMDITVAISKAIEDQYGRVRVCKLNPKMGDLDPSQPAGIRAQKAALLGFYMAVVRDMGATEDSYTFDRFVKDLANGKVISAKFYGKKIDGSVGIFTAKPGVVEFVSINAKVDPYGNGEVTIKPSYATGWGYQEMPDGGLRIVFVRDGNFNDDYEFCSIINEELNSAFTFMGHGLETLSQSLPFSAPRNKFPKTIAALDKTSFQPFTKYGN